MLARTNKKMKAEQNGEGKEENIREEVSEEDCEANEDGNEENTTVTEGRPRSMSNSFSLPNIGSPIGNSTRIQISESLGYKLYRIIIIL